MGGLPSCFLNSIDDRSAYSLDEWPIISTSPMPAMTTTWEVLEDLLTAAHLGVRALRGRVDLLAEAGLDGAHDDVEVEAQIDPFPFP